MDFYIYFFSVQAQAIQRKYKCVNLLNYIPNTSRIDVF